MDMRKLAVFFIIFLTFAPTALWAVDNKYLAGAVHEVNGRVVFTKVYNLKGSSQNSGYDFAYKWLRDRIKENNNDSRIVIENKELGQIVASIEEVIVFKNKPLNRDVTVINYRVIVTCMPEKCEVKIEHIRYDYFNKKITAEEHITDEIALNKKKTSIYPAYKKFRIKTVDYINNVFDSLGTNGEYVK